MSNVQDVKVVEVQKTCAKAHVGINDTMTRDFILINDQNLVDLHKFGSESKRNFLFRVLLVSQSRRN